MDPAVATLDLAKAGAIIADMIESYLAGGAPSSNPEGADPDSVWQQGRRDEAWRPLWLGGMVCAAWC
jgi:hypothetical protein